MRSWKLTPVHQSILEGLSDGKSLRKIASLLGLNHTTVMRHAKQLQERGFISRQVRSNQVIYSLLPAGISNMHHPVREDLTGGSKHAPPPETQQPHDMKIRLHRLQVKYDLVSPVKDPTVISFKDFPSKIVPLEHWSKNIIQFEDFTAILSTKSLIITGVQRYLKAADSIVSQEADVMSAIAPFAEQVEEKIRKLHPGFRIKRLPSSDVDLSSFKLTPIEYDSCVLIRDGIEEVGKIHAALRAKGYNASVKAVYEILSHLAEKDILKKAGPFGNFFLKRPERGELSGKILSREYAYEHHPIAEKAKSMRIDAPDGKPRIIVDQSKGFPELETVHRDTSAEDMEMLTRNTEVLASADLGQAFQVIKASAPIILEQSKLFATTQDQISQLASSLQQVIGILGGMVR